MLQASKIDCRGRITCKYSDKWPQLARPTPTSEPIPKKIKWTKNNPSITNFKQPNNHPGAARKAEKYILNNLAQNLAEPHTKPYVYSIGCPNSQFPTFPWQGHDPSWDVPVVCPFRLEAPFRRPEAGAAQPLKRLQFWVTNQSSNRFVKRRKIYSLPPNMSHIDISHEQNHFYMFL